MTIRIIAIITLVAFLNGILSCATTVKVSRNQVEQEPTRESIVAVTLHSGDVITFNVAGGRLDPERRVIYGRTQDGKNVAVKLDDVQYLEVRRTDTGLTVGWVIGAIAVVGVIIIVIAVSKATEGATKGLFEGM